MNNNKNFITAVLISVVFLVLWSIFAIPRLTPKAPLVVPAATPVLTQSPSSTSASGSVASMNAPFQTKDTTLRVGDSEVVLSSLGGGVKHWRLHIKGQDIDLVNHPDSGILPLSLYPQLSYRVAVKGPQAQLEAVGPEGLRITKVLKLSDHGYLHDYTLRFQNPTGKPIELKDWEWGWGPGIGTAVTEQKENPSLVRAITFNGHQVAKHKEGEYPAPGPWMGIDNRYFLVVVVPDATDHPLLRVTGTKDQTQVAFRNTTVVPARSETVFHYYFYAGPKGYTHLKTYGMNLEHAVDFGMFSSLGRYMLRAIYYLHRITGNYGWAIVLLTVILQILLLPLTLKSFKSMTAMKTMQPKIAELQKKFKDDPKRLNVEMMNLYKTSGTNPFGGCLPMLLQMPIFWALFTSVRNAYELRGAPFVGWVHDLSVADPYHVFPIAVGLGMFVQQRMSGAVTDPTQKQMMYIMPIMMTVMFFNFPAALTIYWFTQSILNMAFQYAFKVYTESQPKTALIR